MSPQDGDRGCVCVDGKVVNKLVDQFELTRQTIAVKNMVILTRLIEQEACSADPRLEAIASLGLAVAAILNAVDD